MLLERLLENLALSVDAFASCRVAPGWRLRLPALDGVTFHYVLNGRCQVKGPSGATRSLSRGWLAVVPPGLDHGIQCGEGPYGETGIERGDRTSDIALHRAGPTDPGEAIVACGRITVSYGRGPGLFDQLGDVLTLDFAGERKVRLLFEGLLEEVRLSRPGTRAMATALMSESLIHILRRLCTAEECDLPWLQALEDPKLGRAVRAMIDDPAQPYTVAFLASLCFMSRSVFARRFREAFGRAPMDYLRDIRLRRAAELLRGEPPLPVHVVAKRVGFSSRSQFSRAFKEYFDRSPSEFALISGDR